MEESKVETALEGRAVRCLAADPGDQRPCASAYSGEIGSKLAHMGDAPPRGGSVGLAGSTDETPKEKGRERVRVLVAYEETHRSYRDAIVRALRGHRPHFTVLGVAPRELEAELERFEPHAVVSSRPSDEYPTSGGKGAWVELPTEPARSGDVCVGGDHEGGVNLDLGEVLGILDEAEKRLRRGALAESC